MEYVRQNYAISKQDKKAIQIAIRRKKWELKRENAKQRPMPTEKVEEVFEEVKIE